MPYLRVIYLRTTLVAHMIKCSMIECWIDLKYAKENGRGLEVFSQHFPGGLRKITKTLKIASLWVETGENIIAAKV